MKMASASRIEINFIRLLHRCEAMASDKESKEWRLEKYVGSLQDQLAEMKRSHGRPPQETINEYQKKVELLKGLITVEKMPLGTQKVLATERLQPVTSSNSSTSVQQLKARAKTQIQEDIRQELLGSKTDSNEAVLRQRNIKGGGDESSDIDSILQYHHRMQEKLADEMLASVQALKQNISDAGRVVRDDIKKLGESTRLADTNYSKLETESGRLEGFTKSSSWWIWIMLLLVIFTFIGMVVFMKIFSKPS